MKKGFTLIELLTVIIVLAVIGLIVFPTIGTIIRESEENTYLDQIEIIKSSARKWAYEHTSNLPKLEHDSIVVTFLELKKGGYLPVDIKNPKTGENFYNGSQVVITYRNNDYDFTVLDVVPLVDMENELSPTIRLNGEFNFSNNLYIEEVEINSVYNELGATAYNHNNEILDNVNITYYDNLEEIPSIDTSKLKTYKVNYEVTDNLLTARITKTIIIVDSIKPIITVPNTTTIKLSDLDNYDFYKDVYVTDNSNEFGDIKISEVLNQIGEQIIKYEVCDLSGNCASVNRLIIVE